MKNILVLGANGMLGYAISKYFIAKGFNVTPITRIEFDIAKESIDNFKLILNNIDIVINCAGIIKPMIKQTTIEDVLRVNSIFPRNLAKICSCSNILCFHITTDCVFSGRKGKYTENDLFDADDIYGMSKNAGETLECMTLRTSIVGEEKDKKKSLLEWARSNAGKEVYGFINHYWNGLTTVYLAEIIEIIINRNLYIKDIFHIHSQTTMNKYELLSLINDIYKLNLSIKPIEAPERIDRSLNTCKSLLKVITIKTLKQQIEEMRSFFRN